MAIGVREDLLDVRDALSFWVSSLRACSPVVRDPTCYGQWNMEALWQHWARDSCDAKAGDERGGEKLDVAASVQETPRNPGVFGLWRHLSRSNSSRFGSFLDR